MFIRMNSYNMWMKKKPACCNNKKVKLHKKAGIIEGVLYGLLPHTGCIAFLIFSILGITTATALLKPIMSSPIFFNSLIIISFGFATLSAALYLKRNDSLSFAGIKSSWKYLAILYSITILVNFLMFNVVFPFAANINSVKAGYLVNAQNITLKVEIPCSGHASLIMDELKAINGVDNVYFVSPNIFQIQYETNMTSTSEILNLDIFNTYEANIIQG
ncbi:Uncharacterised protein [Candidatus Tiddalikarchaeum anstoanum]|nr:Uncharacterised protein [Candidatus Tiddalikarchaeum anstoanum]